MTYRLLGSLLAAGAVLGCTSATPPTVMGRLPGPPAGIATPNLRGVEPPAASITALSAARRLNEEAMQQAQTGQLAGALSLWDKALTLDPYASRLHNNRGYALMLMGRLDEARVSLNLALALSPPSPQAQANLGLLARLQQQANMDAQSERHKQAESQAQQTQGRSEPMSQADEGDPAAPRLVVLGPQVYELRDAPVQSRTPQAIEAWVGQTQSSAHDLAAIKAARLEVSNGVGVRLLAKRTSLKLAEQGVITHRLTNTPGFAQAVTELQFHPKQELAARLLSALLPLAPVLRAQPVDHVRLVLGHDAPGRAVMAWLDGSPAQVTAMGEGRAEYLAQAVLTPMNDGWQWW